MSTQRAPHRRLVVTARNDWRLPIPPSSPPVLARPSLTTVPDPTRISDLFAIPFHFRLHSVYL
ncbi:hypothetical protein BC826DRAFT_552421 [Russula brevipes]|nr:hypothetical protein BC826DRAFT_552421 [Russula brevipes]